MSEIETAMEAAGFEWEHTGGGCSAYVKRYPDGAHIMITDDGWCHAPESLQCAVAVGLYSTEESTGEWLFAFDTVESALAALRILQKC